MYSVIIADDEKKVRTAVKLLVDWESMGLSVLCECEDGDALVERVQTLCPDIVITDMRMSGLSGSDLTKTLGNMGVKPKIIIISGFDDFAYAKQAISSKAVAYLLKPIDPMELKEALGRAIGELNAEKNEAEEPVAIPPSKAEEVKRYLKQNFEQKITLQDIADAFHMNKEYLSKLFSKAYGMKISEYVDMLKIERAKELLSKGGYTVGEITEQLQFYDESHFSKKFKKITGVSPKEYKP